MSQGPDLREHGGGAGGFHCLEGTESDVRRNAALIAAGIAFTAALFFALPFMQVISPPVDPPPIPVNPAIALQTPQTVIPPPRPEVEKVEPLKPEELVQPRPQPTIGQIIADLGPGGTGTLPVATWNPAEIIPEIFTTDQLDRVPNAIYTVAPDVPRGARHGGNVLLEFIVTPQGSVTAIKVISSTDRVFERLAVDAIAKWRFEPGVKNNQPVSTRIRLPIRFNVAN